MLLQALATDMRSLLETEWTEEDNRFTLSPPPDSPTITEVTTQLDAAGGCDGIKTGRFGFHTASGEIDPWWQVDLGKPTKLDRVVIFNRTDGRPERTAKLQLQIALDSEATAFDTIYRHNGRPFYGVKEKRPLIVDLSEKDVTAQIVRLQIPGRCSFALDEIEVYGLSDPKMNLALHRPCRSEEYRPLLGSRNERPRIHAAHAIGTRTR